ncbi:MAG: LamG domain-containing protein [Bacteroidetes bacterium]|nr:LamG domain-containing protein [Bacteroidota bacterium]
MRYLSTLLTFILISGSLLAQPCINNTNSLSFNTASVNFTSDTNLAPDSAITVEAWIRATSWAFNSFDGTILCKHSWSLGEQGYVLRAGNNGQLNFTVCGKDAFGTSISWVTATSLTGAMALNTWYHVAGTYDGDSVRVFINGIQQGSIALPDGMIAGLSYPIKIGRLSDQAQSQTRYWTGQIDEVRIWERALNSSEIIAKHDHHLDPAQETGLVGYWRFNDGSGTTVTDQTVNGNNGTTSAATWSTLVPFNQTAAMPTIFPNGFVLTSSITAVSYQWNLNGNPILNATGQSWTAVANGSYTVTITDSLGCTATSSPYIIAGVGIIEIAAEDILVRNEPSQLIISLKSGENIQSIEIFNAAMQLIDRKASPSNEVRWNKEDVGAGMYQVVIRTAFGKTGVYRFVQVD